MHQVDDALADCQPKAGAAIQAGGRGIGLGEGVEQALLLRAVQADAGVAYLEAQLVLGWGFAQAGHLDVDAAARGELDGIDQQVAQYLPQPHRVATHRQAYRWVDMQGQLQALVLAGALHQRQHALQGFAQVEGGDLQFQPVRFQLGVIQDVVDDAEQLARAFGGGGQHPALLAIQWPLRDQFQHRQDAIERRADLVAHRGQELTLGQGGGLGRFLGLQQLGLQLVVQLPGKAQLARFQGEFLAAQLQCMCLAGHAVCSQQRQQCGQGGSTGKHRRDHAWQLWQPRSSGRCSGKQGCQCCADAAGTGAGQAHSTAFWKSKLSSLPARCTTLPWMKSTPPIHMAAAACGSSIC